MLEQVDEHGGTLLHYAAYAGFLGVVDVLLKAGAKPSIFRECLGLGYRDQHTKNRKD